MYLLTILVLKPYYNVRCKHCTIINNINFIPALFDRAAKTAQPLAGGGGQFWLFYLLKS